MRILFLHRDLPPDSYTGVAIQVHRLAESLTALGHEVSVLTRSALPPGARYRVLPADGPLLRLALRLLPGLKRIWYPLWYRFAPKEGYDVVHVHGDGGLLRYRPGYVRTFYGTAGMELRHSRSLKGRLAQGLSYRMERRESRRCAACVGISPHIAGFLPGVDRVIPCLLPGDPDPGPRAKTPHPSLLFLGSRNSRKRGELAIDLYRRLRPAFPGLRLTYVGPRADADALAGAPGLEGVEFRSGLGQDELIRRYRESWAYLCLSSYEGFGVGIIEAMAHGCPVLTTPHPGSDYLVRDGEDAVVAAPEAAADALAALLADRPRREALAARARERSRRFSPATVAAAYLELYRAAAAPDGAPREAA
jgi:glycosyltransferase involved in cell wall biosynthesis